MREREKESKGFKWKFMTNQHQQQNRIKGEVNKKTGKTQKKVVLCPSIVTPFFSNQQKKLVDF